MDCCQYAARKKVFYTPHQSAKYLCEARFSVVTATKQYHEPGLDVGNTLRISSSTTTLQQDHFVAEKQAQGPH